MPITILFFYTFLFGYPRADFPVLFPVMIEAVWGGNGVQ